MLYVPYLIMFPEIAFLHPFDQSIDRSFTQALNHGTSLPCDFEVTPRTYVNCLSHATSCLGLQEKESQAVDLMSLAWVSHVADAALIPR